MKTEESKEKIRAQDRRVFKTKKVIREAFVSLLAEKDLEKITIKEIALRADVDRKTVYNYYGSIYDIQVELENELAKSFEHDIKNFNYTTFEPREIFAAFAGFLEENLELFDWVMRIKSSARLISKINFFLRVKIRESIGKNNEIDPLKIELATEYVTAGLFCVYRYWFNGDRKQPLKEFTQHVADLVMQGLPEYLTSV